jgi:hypothetical protein
MSSALAEHPIVFIGMPHNPHCREVRRTLTAGGFGFKYLEYGSHFSKRRELFAAETRDHGGGGEGRADVRAYRW